jgi:ABC-type lipoprotein export system ATPase subunit/GNAT superfamily N-acetyltransferase
MQLKSTVELDDITIECAKSFDFEFDGNSTFDVPILKAPPEFQIGLIVGPSGSGKSTLLAQFGDERQIDWVANKSICSHFNSAEEAMTRLGAVGLNSVPVWVKPYHVLSTGERFRADLARRLVDGAVIDEFTSVVDRNVAKSCSYATSRYVRKEGLKNIVFATCHYDIVEWLQPDWVFDTTVGVLSTRGVERRPTIELELVPSTVGAWALFSKHHYLTANINRSARCWVAKWENTAIGFAAVIPMPSGTLQNAWRGHRTVVLPEFQGLGLGVRISDAMGMMVRAEGGRYFSKSSSPRLGEYRNNSPLWKPTSKNQKVRGDSKSQKKWTNQNYRLSHAERLCYSHEFVG